jgi:hypothetical protein
MEVQPVRPDATLATIRVIRRRRPAAKDRSPPSLNIVSLR